VTVHCGVRQSTAVDDIPSTLMLLALYSESGHCIWSGAGRKESWQNGAPHPSRHIGLTCGSGRPGRVPDEADGDGNSERRFSV
jgi:hypothetical protein